MVTRQWLRGAPLSVTFAVGGLPTRLGNGGVASGLRSPKVTESLAEKRGMTANSDAVDSLSACGGRDLEVGRGEMTRLCRNATVP